MDWLYTVSYSHLWELKLRTEVPNWANTEMPEFSFLQEGEYFTFLLASVLRSLTVRASSTQADLPLLGRVHASEAVTTEWGTPQLIMLQNWPSQMTRHIIAVSSVYYLTTPSSFTFSHTQKQGQDRSFTFCASEQFLLFKTKVISREHSSP